MTDPAQDKANQSPPHVEVKAVILLVLMTSLIVAFLLFYKGPVS